MTLPRQIQYQDYFFPVLPQPIPFVPFDSYQGSSEYPWQFHRPRSVLNYTHQFVFYTPTELEGINITRASAQGSNERHLSYQQGDPRYQNYLKPSVFWTPITDQDRGITAAAFQGSNVRPNPQVWALNYLKEWTFRMPKYIVPPRTMTFINRVISVRGVPFTMTFGISCNYQSEQALVVSFTPDAPLIDSFTADPMQVVTWTPDSPYCKPGQP